MIRARLRGGERKGGTAKRTKEEQPSERPRKSRRRERDADATAGAKVRLQAQSRLQALRIIRLLTCVVLAQDEEPGEDSSAAVPAPATLVPGAGVFDDSVRACHPLAHSSPFGVAQRWQSNGASCSCSWVRWPSCDLHRTVGVPTRQISVSPH